MQDENYPKPILASVVAESEAPPPAAQSPLTSTGKDTAARPQVSVRPLELRELDEAFALARAHPDLRIIASEDVVRRVLVQNAYTFWGVYPAESGTPLLGYYVFLLLNANGEQALIDGDIDFLNPDPALLAATGEKPEAIYIWLMVVPGLSSRATPMVTSALGKVCKGAPLYARAATQQGLNLMRRQGFRPTDADRDGIGALHIFGPIDSLKVRESRAAKAKAGPKIEFKAASTAAEVDAAMAIRAAVYLIEQNCPYEEEFDGNDRTATHLLATVGGEPAATLRLRYFADVVKIERASVLPRFRSTHVASELVHFTIEFCRRKGYRKIFGHVQKRLVGYWARFGFYPLDPPQTLVFSDHEYEVLLGHFEPHPKALGIHSDPYELLRVEGKWDEPGILELSAKRPPTNPH